MAAKKKRAAAPKKHKAPATVEERIAAVPPALSGRYPNEPVASFAGLAAKTAVLAEPERARLLLLPDFEAWWLDCGAFSALLLEAERDWSIAHKKTRAGTAPARVREAKALKREVYTCARYLLRNDPVVQEVLDGIARGHKVTKLAMDLTKLEHLVNEHAAVFSAALAPGLVDRLAPLSMQLMLGVSNGAALTLQERRNRLFWLTKQATTQVREALRFLWRHQPEQLAELGVTYTTERWRTKKKQAPKKQEP